MKYTKDRIELIKNFPTLLQGKPGSFHPFDVGKTIFRSFSFLSMLYLLSIKLIWKEHAFQQLTSNLSHYDKTIMQIVQIYFSFTTFNSNILSNIVFEKFSIFSSSL